jgi:hypothetical protein
MGVIDQGALDVWSAHPAYIDTLINHAAGLAIHLHTAGSSDPITLEAYDLARAQYDVLANWWTGVTNKPQTIIIPAHMAGTRLTYASSNHGTGYYQLLDECPRPFGKLFLTSGNQSGLAAGAQYDMLPVSQQVLIRRVNIMVKGDKAYHVYVNRYGNAIGVNGEIVLTEATATGGIHSIIGIECDQQLDVYIVNDDASAAMSYRWLSWCELS